MPFRLNRPFSLGKYAKIRLNKKSIGLQVGGKYFKGTVNTKGQATGSFGGAGTGMYIQKTTNLKKRTKCNAITKSGKQCSRNSNKKSIYCSQHENTNLSSIESNTGPKNEKVQISKNIDYLLSNNIFLTFPKDQGLDLTVNLFHTTSESLEKLHTNQDVIAFQKNILVYINFVAQDLIYSIKRKRIASLSGYLNSDLQSIEKVGSAFLTNIMNASLSTARLIAPIKFLGETKRNLFGKTYPFDYSVFDHLNFESNLSDKDLTQAIDFILINYNNWNNLHGYVEGELSPEVEEGSKIYSDPSKMLLPNSFNGKYDISDEVLTFQKGFDFEHFLDIFIRFFASASKNELKSTKTFQILENSFSNSSIDIQKKLDHVFNRNKDAKNIGTYSSNVEAF